LRSLKEIISTLPTYDNRARHTQVKNAEGVFTSAEDDKFGEAIAIT
jgi:hypothetical protein